MIYGMVYKVSTFPFIIIQRTPNAKSSIIFHAFVVHYE
jgi:hypothetical protein